jgi:hypothetical protein
MGPTRLADSPQEILHRLIALLETAAGEGIKLVVFRELAFSTFFPRWPIAKDYEGAF